MKRNSKIDILKGIAILLVVMGHTCFGGTEYIYLFHMAVFFMASGYFFRDKQSDSVSSLFTSIKKRLQKIWVPFVVWNAIFTLLNNVFIKMNIYTSDEIVSEYLKKSLVSIHHHMGIKEMAVNIVKGIFLAGHTELGGTFWFLRALFYIAVAYLCINFILLKLLKNDTAVIVSQAVISVVFLITGFVMGKKGFNSLGLDLMFSYYCLYFLGIVAGRITPTLEKHLTTKLYLLLTVIGIAIIGILNNFGSIALDHNKYDNPILLLVASVVGWIMLYSLSSVVELVPSISKVFTYLGQNSIIIMIFQFLFFKPVSLLIAMVKGWPLQTVAGFPVSYTEGAWWILYTVVSTALCSLVAYIWKRIHHK